MAHRNVQRELPGFVSYSEFMRAMGGDVLSEPLPDRSTALKVAQQIAVGNDFLMGQWMRAVRRAWQASLELQFAFVLPDGAERYWWCDVASAKGWKPHAYLLLAVDARGGLLRYALYTYGSEGTQEPSFCIRFHDEKGCESEVSYKSVSGFLSGIVRMAHSDDNFICCDLNREDYIQASLNRDGTFYVEYQLYHMPWQMCCRGLTREEVLFLVKEYSAGGVPAIANLFDWRCCERPSREHVDLGALLKTRLADAERKGNRLFAETIRAVNCERDLTVPLFVRKGRPTRWTSSLYYMPKNTSRQVLAAVKVGAALFDRSFANYAHEVGMLFSSGEGVVRNYDLALQWEVRARRLGSSKANHEILRLKNVLDPKRKAKSLSRRMGFQKTLESICCQLEERKIKPDVAYERISEVEVSCECNLHDCLLTKRDYSVLQKLWSGFYERFQAELFPEEEF